MLPIGDLTVGLIATIREAANSDNPKVRYAVGGAAILMILAAIGVMIYTLGDWGQPTEQDLPALKYFCMKCRQEFEVTHDDLARLDAAAAAEGRAGLRSIDCAGAGCGGKATAYAMFRCPDPDCRKYFVTPADRSHYGQTLGKPANEDMKLLCSHCGIDVDQWRRDHRP